MCPSGVHSGSVPLTLIRSDFPRSRLRNFSLVRRLTAQAVCFGFVWIWVLFALSDGFGVAFGFLLGASPTFCVFPLVGCCVVGLSGRLDGFG